MFHFNEFDELGSVFEMVFEIADCTQILADHINITYGH